MLFFFLFAFALKYCFIFLYSFIQFSLIKMGGKKQSFFLVLWTLSLEICAVYSPGISTTVYSLHYQCIPPY